MWFLSSRKNRRSNSAPARPRTRPCLEMLEDRCVPSAGQLDPTFGSGGVVVTNVNPLDSFSHVVIQPDGKVLAIGPSTTKNYFHQSILIRYTTSGALDSTFGSGGILTTSNGYTQVALQADGKIVIAGGANVSADHQVEFELARFNANGTVDKTFGNKGTVTTPFSGGNCNGASGNALAIQSDGKIIVAGNTAGTSNAATVWALARYNANGSLDTTFGSGG